MDDADMAEERMEQEAEFRRRAPKKPELPYKGQCYYCATDLPHPKKFCDKECSEGFEFEQRMLERNGRG